MGTAVTKLRNRWRDLTQNLGFIPGSIVVLFAVIGLVLVAVDQRHSFEGVEVVFQGDGAAARTVLSVVAGSLITVAGLTFSITMVVLQLASSQFSPRILRSLYGDRVTQITVGTYVGTFVYAILVLRSVGSYADGSFVPRLSVTIAALLGIAAVVLLIVFLHHVSQMVQVAHVTATIARRTLARIDVLYPDGFGDRTLEDAGTLLASWREKESGGMLLPERPGYVQRVALEQLLDDTRARAERIALLVCPGDFVSVESPLAEVWPPAAARDCRQSLLDAIPVQSERDLDQDVDFGARQLADTAMKAMSSGINDPMTAITCIGYLQSIMVRLAERDDRPSIRTGSGQESTLLIRHRGFEEHLEVLMQIGRYVDGDVWVTGELLKALESCAVSARRCGAGRRSAVAAELATTIASTAQAKAVSERDRRIIRSMSAWAADPAGTAAA